MRFKIPGTLPGLNEIINVSKSSWMDYARLKRDHTEAVYFCILETKKEKIVKFDRVDIRITWYCPNKRKDKDNITAGVKFILDGLQMAGVIKNDGWNQIGTITHIMKIDKENPRIEVELKEVQDV